MTHGFNTQHNWLFIIFGLAYWQSYSSESTPQMGDLKDLLNKGAAGEEDLIRGI